MLRSLRDGAKSTPMRIFLVALAVGFALWGIDDVFRAVGSNDKAVQVGKVNVTALEAAQEFDRTRRRYLPSSSSSEAVAAGLLNSVMTGLVQQSLFIAEAERMDLTVTRRMEKQTIANEPAFRDDAGRFSTIRFNDALARTGLNEESYLEFMGRLLMRRQIMDAINGGLDYPEATAMAIASWRLEKRIINHASIKVDQDAVPTPDDAAVRAWYSENSTTFDSPDLRFVTYVLAEPDAFLDQVEISDDDVAAAYDARVDLYQTPESRTISQMIFPDADTAAEAISRLNAGEDFAAVAMDMLGLTGDDTLLGDLSRDDLTDDLANAAFGLAAEGIAGPVQTPLGHHVLNIVGIIPANVIPLEDARKGLTDDLRREGATDLVYERINDIEDALASGQTIEEAARSTGARLVTINGMDRNGLDRDGNAIEGIATDTDFREIVWTAPIGEAGMVEEIDTDSFIIARVDREETATPRELAEVESRVIDAMKREQAITNAREIAAEIAGASDPVSTASKNGISFSEDISMRRDGVGLDHQAARLIANEAFNLESGNTGYIETGEEAIVVTTKAITDADADAVKNEGNLFRQRLAGEMTQSTEIAMLQNLEKRFDINVNPAVVQQLLFGAGN